MKQFSIGLTLMAILAAILLMGQAFGFKSFGGTGFANYLVLHMDGKTWHRGSTYTFEETKAISPLLYYSSDINLTITGEKGTQIEFTDTRPDSFTIRLITGRVTFDGDGKVLVNKVPLTMNGAAEIIHYSWKQAMEITLTHGALSLGDNSLPIGAPYHALLSTETGLVVNP